MGQRHGVDSGKKRRAVLTNYGSLVADFLFGLCNVAEGKELIKTFQVIHLKNWPGL